MARDMDRVVPSALWPIGMPGAVGRGPDATSGSPPKSGARSGACSNDRWSLRPSGFGYLRGHRRLRISHETIYRYIWADKQLGGTLYTHGSRAPRK